MVSELSYEEIEKEYIAALKCALRAATEDRVVNLQIQAGVKFSSEDVTKLALSAFMERRRSIVRKSGY